MEDSLLHEKIISTDSTEHGVGLSYIYDKWKPALIRDIKFILGGNTWAEDVFSCALDKFVIEVRKGKWKRRSLKGYLRKICTNLAIDYKKKGSIVLEKKKKGYSRKKLTLNFPLLEILFKEIGFECTVVIWLFRFVGYTHTQISKVTGYTTGTSKKKNSDCFKKLFERLKNDPLLMQKCAPYVDFLEPEIKKRKNK